MSLRQVAMLLQSCCTLPKPLQELSAISTRFAHIVHPTILWYKRAFFENIAPRRKRFLTRAIISRVSIDSLEAVVIVSRIVTVHQYVK